MRRGSIILLISGNYVAFLESKPVTAQYLVVDF